MNRAFNLSLAAALCLPIAVSTLSAQTLTVTYPSATASTPPLSQLPDGPKPQGNSEHAHHAVPSHAGKGGGQDTAVQTQAGALISATGGVNFDGPGANGFAPSDSNIAVGPNHIFAVVNSVYQIYSKTGASLLGPKSLSSLWTGVGGGCATANAGDVVVQYDKIADRWILTELSSLSSPYGECIAVSTSPDPTGTYFAYYYTFNTTLPDYPKFGVWPTASNSAYLATYNQFANGANFAGAALCAYDRTALLAGAASPAQICYTINDASYLPSDLDGSTPPVDGTPGYFLTYETLSSLRLWTIAPNFANPAASTLTQVTPDLNVTSFAELCGGATCVPQAGTTNQLDSLADRPMYRLAFRNYGSHESMVVNHSVTSGVRWYELQSPVSASGTFSVFQQGTYAPDSSYRWMGSAAMDQAGDLAIGYSASSSSIYPAVRYSGRVSTDPLGTLESEASIIEGTGAQTNGLHRWGDYSSLRIDPADDCTFWYINQYLKSSGAFNWSTRIGSFKFSGCSGTPTPDFTVSVTPSSQSVSQGTPASYTVTVTSLNSFNGPVALTVNCPAGATCPFTSTPITPPANGIVQTTLTINNAPGGTSSLTVNGASGTLNHNATPVSLTVTVPDFSLSSNPGSVTVTQGNGGSSTITATSLNGYSSMVNLVVTGCPANTTCALNPTQVTPPAGGTATSTLNITTTSTTPTGTVTLTITGNGVHTTTVSLTVNAPAGDFSLGASNLTVRRKSNNSESVAVHAVGASSSVTLSISGLPSQTSATFSPNPVTTSATSSSTLRISANRNAPPGNYTVTITGKNSANTHTTTFMLTIQ